MYDPPEAAEEDFYGPVDHAIIRFKKCFGLHTYCYRVALCIVGKILIRFHFENVLKQLSLEYHRFLLESSSAR